MGAEITEERAEEAGADIDHRVELEVARYEPHSGARRVLRRLHTCQRL